MKTVNGVYTSAKIFTDTIEDYALAQIQMLCDNEAFAGCTVRIMPDVHPGKVGTIGFTSTVGKRVLPNVVGIDVGCGVTLGKLKQKKAEFGKLDKVIREKVPCGFGVRKKSHRFNQEFDFLQLHCVEHVNIEKAELSLGTLGGGNHFLELDQDEDGNLYAVVHSGSRRLGKEVTEYYLTEGQKDLKKRGISVPYEMTYLEGALMEKYLQDIQIVQEFAELNRYAILDELAKGMKWKIQEQISSVHNLGVGKGNADWNYSASHGAGRRMKREEVKTRYTVSQFKTEMKGIYSSCIGKDTLDEAPFAYRNLKEIEGQIGDTVEIRKRLKPIYNFKAGTGKS